MRLLLDTHLLLWLASDPERVPAAHAMLIADPRNEVWFSAASIWEVAIKSSLGRADFEADPRLLRAGLRGAEYRELAVSSDHAAAVAELPRHHADPFDRMLIAQAQVEFLTLLTHDAALVPYGGVVRYA